MGGREGERERVEESNMEVGSWMERERERSFTSITFVFFM